MLTNELQSKQRTGYDALLPYLPGHDYVLLPGAGDGQVRIAYSDVVPTSLQKYAYMTSLPHSEVIVYTFSSNTILANIPFQVLDNPKCLEDGSLGISTYNKFSALEDVEEVS